MKLILTTNEHNELRDIRSREKNISVLGILQNELGVVIEIDDDKAAAERALVLADPTLLRRYIAITPLQYYELFIILDTLGAAAAPVIFQELMKDVWAGPDLGFPLYLSPKAPILELPVICTVGDTQVVFISNARPLEDVSVTILDDAGAPVGGPILVTADLAGNSQFQFVVPIGAFTTLEAEHIVVTAAETTNIDILHTNIYYVATV